ncbi:ABC transporter ATP-binding protein [Streptacidiphilus jiangxiensis]|uniref:Peptide/nickel transport system ATP-binding protein n=1 Tax=Streptacidiphilus jiangxiensis TaxID=235985 RepID=A0A1H8A314_STRJI|nr:ABC transporter ATP-binding protein [Streptacidiphilus jiangxiensis]SEM64923.1 peptide/nickel transport system ATP-binding protein [Streptacidiphilus jiangxiensis]
MAIELSPQSVDVNPPSSFLEVRDLRVHFPTEDGLVKSVDGVSFSLEKGKTLGIVGESGSGKSVTSLSLLGLHKGSRAQVGGEIWLDGEELVGMSESQMRGLRGRKVSMIFQDPLSALHPFYSVGSQIAEAYQVHHKASKKEAKERAIEMLKRVGIPQPERRAKDYPHQFSGGMRQRAMIAMSLVCDPELLIADEPTTALDVTVQAQILDLIRDLQEEFGSAVIIITHDLGVVAEISDDILVMYGGRRIEYGSVNDVLKSPEHPYTWGLLQSMPHLGGDVAQRLNPIPGSPPSLINLPSGCAFNPRCSFKEQVPDGRCTVERPELLPVLGSDKHIAACHLTGEHKAEIRRGATSGAK